MLEELISLDSQEEVLLWDNLWGTNYVQWWPFVVPPPVEYGASSEFFPVEGNADFAARFEMKFS